MNKRSGRCQREIFRTNQNQEEEAHLHVHESGKHTSVDETEKSHKWILTAQLSVENDEKTPWKEKVKEIGAKEKGVKFTKRIVQFK